MSERQKDLLGVLSIGLFTLICCLSTGVLVYFGLYGFLPIWLVFVLISAWCTGEWIGFYREDVRRDRD